MSNLGLKEIIGYYEGENLIRPIFNRLSCEEFLERFPGKEPVLASHLADDDDYIPDEEEEEVEVDF
jgi:hypothetical protein